MSGTKPPSRKRAFIVGVRILATGEAREQMGAPEAIVIDCPHLGARGRLTSAVEHYPGRGSLQEQPDAQAVMLAGIDVERVEVGRVTVGASEHHGRAWRCIHDAKGTPGLG
ncbi:MAG: hypothetical protein OXG44_18615 [Gammaproteobacteria bacterium]|nr:hypothetical protein [Gammaproteobacteria bacterium]